MNKACQFIDLVHLSEVISRIASFLSWNTDRYFDADAQRIETGRGAVG